MTMHIGHVALRVTDLEDAAKLYRQALGLREVHSTPEERRLTSNGKRYELQLLQAPVAGLDHVGLEVESAAEFEEVAPRLLAAGAERIDSFPQEEGLGPAARFLGPADIVYEIYDGMERDPLGSDAYLQPGIRRLGHLTFFSEEHEAIVAFWVDALGFRVSDRLEGMTWTRCDSDHHGLAAGPRPGGSVLHHTAWEVQDLGALAQYCDDLARHDLALGWGPVRHGPGFNIATYLPDRDGAMIEVYTDLLKIYDERSYVPVDWSQTPAALNMWGPGPDESVLTAGVPPMPPIEVAEGVGS